MQWAVTLEMSGGPIKTEWVLVDRAIDMDVSKMVALEAGHVVARIR